MAPFFVQVYGFGQTRDSTRTIIMKTRFEIMRLTSCVALIAVALSNSVFSAAFLKLGDIKGEGFKEVPLETECYVPDGKNDGKYQCKSPNANEAIVMQCNKSVRLPKVVTIAEVVKQYPNECGVYVPDGRNDGK